MITIDKSIHAASFTKAADCAEYFGGKREITGITIHHWGALGQNFHSVVSFFANDEDAEETSAHYVVMAGRITQLVDEEDVAWHAGNKEGNRTTIGIELRPEATDEDYEAAAELIRNIRKRRGELPLYPHNHWKATTCPGDYDLARLDKLVKTGKDTPKMPQMVSPFQGRLTAHHWKTGGYRGHKGMDIAPPRPGQTGLPVYAAFDGVVKKTYTSSKHGNLRSTWAPGRTGNGCLVANPDGEGNGYNHMKPIVKVGQKVKAGDVLGYNDTSGNQSGPHLHFELWEDWTNPDSDYPPSWAFDKFKIKPGSVPSVKGHVDVAGKINSKDTNDKEDNEAIQRALKSHGYYDGEIDGVDGDMQKAAVKAFQKRHGLVQDGYWGPVTQQVWDDAIAANEKRAAQKAAEKAKAASKPKGYNPVIEAYQKAQLYYPNMAKDGIDGPRNKAHKAWTKRLQNKLNGWQSVIDLGLLQEDGDYRKRVWNAVVSTKKRNAALYRSKGGHNTNGVADRAFCAMIGISHHPYG